MKGVLFNVVQDVVESTMNCDAWDHVLADAHLDGAYTSLGDYHGTEMAAIVAALSERSGLPQEEVFRLAGEHGYTYLAERHADLIGHYPTFGDLLGNLDAVIHPEVLKLYPDARPPRFDVAPMPAGDGWVVTYRSCRGLCHLADGLLRGAANSFGYPHSIEQTRCTHSGDPACVFEVSPRGDRRRDPGRT